jgi:hypothetical protein
MFTKPVDKKREAGRPHRRPLSYLQLPAASCRQRHSLNPQVMLSYYMDLHHIHTRILFVEIGDI